MGKKGKSGWPEGLGANGRRLSEQWEQRKSSKIKTNTVYGNTKTLVTPSPPKGPRPHPLRGAARPGGRSLRLISSPCCPQWCLHVCEHPPICWRTCVCVSVFVCTRPDARLRKHKFSPSGEGGGGTLTRPIEPLYLLGRPYLGPSLSASRSCLRGCRSGISCWLDPGSLIIPALCPGSAVQGSLSRRWKCRWKL